MKTCDLDKILTPNDGKIYEDYFGNAIFHEIFMEKLKVETGS